MSTFKGPSNNTTGLFYKTRQAEGTSHVTMRLPNELQHGIERIKKAFAARFPERSYPTLTLALQIAIERSLKEFEEDPEQLQREVEYFERRYYKKSSH